MSTGIALAINMNASCNPLLSPSSNLALRHTHSGDSLNRGSPLKLNRLSLQRNRFNRPNRLTTLAQGFSGLEMSEDERKRKEERVREKIEKGIAERAQELKQNALKKNLESELKLGKVFFNEGQYERAIIHFDKVISLTPPSSRQHCDGVIQKAECFEKMGRSAEAHHLYESLITFRAPFPDLKRRAVHGIQRIDGVTISDKNDVSLFEEYLNRLYSDGFASYFPKGKRYVESESDRMTIQLITLSILLVGPILAVSLVYRYFH